MKLCTFTIFKSRINVMYPANECVYNKKHNVNLFLINNNLCYLSILILKGIYLLLSNVFPVIIFHFSNYVGVDCMSTKKTRSTQRTSEHSGRGPLTQTFLTILFVEIDRSTLDKVKAAYKPIKSHLLRSFAVWIWSHRWWRVNIIL